MKARQQDRALPFSIGKMGSAWLLKKRNLNPAPAEAGSGSLSSC